MIVQKNCEQCGQPFEKKIANVSEVRRGKRGRFCSRLCANKANAKRNAEAHKAEKNPNFGKPTWNRGKTPSEATKEKLAKANKGKKHSEEDKAKMRLNQKHGADHHKWKGGVTPKNLAIRLSSEYRDWRHAVEKRGGYKCKNCGTWNNLVAHHILNFAEYTNLRMEPENGAMLCRSCHEKFHLKFGKNNNNMNQLGLFLEAA